MAIKKFVVTAASTNLDHDFINSISSLILNTFSDLCADDASLVNKTTQQKYDYVLDMFDNRPSSQASLLNAAIRQHGFETVRKFLIKNLPI